MEIPIIGQQRERSVIQVRNGVMDFLAAFHDVAQFYNWGLHCPKCSKAIGGLNSGHEREFVIACECTEWRGNRGGGGLATAPNARGSRT